MTYVAALNPDSNPDPRVRFVIHKPSRAPKPWRTSYRGRLERNRELRRRIAPSYPTVQPGHGVWFRHPLFSSMLAAQDSKLHAQTAPSRRTRVAVPLGRT